MTILADHITLGGITRLAFQQEPNRLLWATLATGNLVCFTYERSQQVTAWHRHTLGGTDAKVESIAVIPHPSGDQDQLWLIVSRTIGGTTKRFVKVMEPECPGGCRRCHCRRWWDGLLPRRDVLDPKRRHYARVDPGGQADTLPSQARSSWL
ncbi:MAG TPA: hypothetical protein EYQ64_03890 [Gemmatimonadetes bacterium]|nr:hypothetical protein [Gemmatimonadota bacterium]